MTGFITLLLLFISLFLQFSLGHAFSLWGVSPPIFVYVALVRSWHMKKGARPLFGIFCGLLLDSITAGPPGIYTLTLFILTLLVHFWQSIFANSDSRFIRAIGIAALLFLYGVLAMALDIALPYALRGVYFPLLWGSGVLFPLLAAFFWAVVFSFIFFIMGLLRRHEEKI